MKLHGRFAAAVGRANGHGCEEGVDVEEGASVCATAGRIGSLAGPGGEGKVVGCGVAMRKWGHHRVNPTSMVSIAPLL